MKQPAFGEFVSCGLRLLMLRFGPENQADPSYCVSVREGRVLGLEQIAGMTMDDKEDPAGESETNNTAGNVYFQNLVE
jgi:hypothetical protein